MRRAMQRVWLGVLVTACGTSVSSADGGGEGDAALVADAAAEDAGAEHDAATGPRVFVHLRATHEALTHDSASRGQTPRAWTSGIRSLHLLRTEDDPDPMLVFTHGDGYVEASYADGADTIVGSAPLSALREGTFTWARVVHTHVRFTVDATLHSSLGTFPGEVDELIVLSDRTTVDGVTRASGWYRYVFRTGGMAFPAEGSGFTVPPIPGGGFYARLEEGETAYYFVAPLEVRDVGEDVHLIFEVNVHEGFRWLDRDEAGYEDGVFDTTPTGTEPVVQAGANTYAYFLE